MDWPADKVERRAIATLVPYARNARTHSAEQVAQIAASIREWGWTVPVLVDEDGGIIAGHGRVLAAHQLGVVDIPVMVASGWSKAQKQAYVLADNKLTLNAGWDEALLRVELADLTEMGFDLSLTGFGEQELAALSASGVGLTDPDEVPELSAHPISEAGDLWLLGPHRLVCDNCRESSVVTNLLDGRKINLAFTSPPYAEQRAYEVASGFKPIKPSDYLEWFAPVAANVAAHLADDGSWFVNIKPAAGGLDTELYVFDLVLAHARQWGWHFATEFCWERHGVPKGVTQRFKNQFEPIYQFVRNRWKMRPDAVRHESDNVPIAGGPGSWQRSWSEVQGGRGNKSVPGSFGAAKKRRNGSKVTMSKEQGKNIGVGEYIGAGLAYPGNRLPSFSRTHEATGHAAAFPVGLPRFFCLAYTDDADLVFDPFVGSGSTIIAAEMTGRACHAIEISPTYVDVAVLRWQAFTGQAATLEGDGRTFDEIAEQRERAAA